MPGLRGTVRGRRAGALASGALVALAWAAACGSGEGTDEATALSERTGVRPGAVQGVQDTVSAAADGPGDVRAVRIRVGGIPVTVEVAETEAARQRGLMYRDTLPEDHGMLFVYEAERNLSFWMRNTRIPLDIAFIDRAGRIVDIQQMEAMSEETHTSRAPAMYALEMRLGWFEERGIRVGDRVEF